MRLSESEVDQILANLPDEKVAQLLAALQRQREEEAAQRELDTRPPLSQLVKDCVEEESRKTDDPEAFLAAYAAHTECVQRHMAQLRPTGADEWDVAIWIAERMKARNEARDRAAKDGHPSPRREDYIKRELEPEPEEAALDTLPPAVRDAIVETKALERAAPRPAAPARDPLAGFRSQDTGLTPPAHWDQ